MEASVKQLLDADASRLRPGVAIATVVVALLLQAYLPLFFSYVNVVDLPLLVTIHLALLRRSPVAGLFLGLAIGLGQDSLSNGPVGLYGILKTVIGYVCSSLTTVIDVWYLTTRVVLVFGLYLMHQLLFWIMQRVLLAQAAVFVWERTFLLAFVNVLVALLVYRLLDRFRERT